VSGTQEGGGARVEDPAFDPAGQDRLASLSSKLGAPTTGVLVLEGRRGRYYEADPELRHLSAGSVGQRMAAVGYELVGGLLAERFRRVVVRGFARFGGHAYGLLLLPPENYRAIEFYTRFADGSSLTSTTHPGPGDDPSRMIFRRRHSPKDGVADIEGRHREDVGAHAAARATSPIECVPTLRGLAEALDEFLVRYDG
jgi:hypothetical protein